MTSDGSLAGCDANEHSAVDIFASRNTNDAELNATKFSGADRSHERRYDRYYSHHVSRSLGPKRQHIVHAILTRFVPQKHSVHWPDVHPSMRARVQNDPRQRRWRVLDTKSVEITLYANYTHTTASS